MPCVVGRNPDGCFGVRKQSGGNARRLMTWPKWGLFGVTGCPSLGKPAEPQDPCASLSFQLDSLILGHSWHEELLPQLNCHVCTASIQRIQHAYCSTFLGSGADDRVSNMFQRISPTNQALCLSNNYNRGKLNAQPPFRLDEIRLSLIEMVEMGKRICNNTAVIPRQMRPLVSRSIRQARLH